MSAADRNYQEKRDFIRMQVSSDMSIKHAGQEHSAICKNLSGAGLLIECKQPFNPGDEIEVLIPQKGETHQPFHAITEVNRVEAIAEDKYHIGLSIKSILN